MKITLITLCLLLLGVIAPIHADLPGQGPDIGRTVIYRDTWGIPHIYAPTVEAGLYAMGYAQAEDRPNQLLINFKTALGELAEIAGADQYAQDVLTRMFDHIGMARTFVVQASPRTRARLTAFADGINAWYAAHPEDVPEWWGSRQVDAAMVDAFGRLFLYNWSIDEALGDLERGGIAADFAKTTRGSNQWAVSPSRSASGHAILLIDPHLSWWGPSRFWEMRIHAGELVGSGVGLAGNPYIGLGHNENVAWAMTTGGPDTADVFELTLNPDNPDQYRYDGKWRDITSRTVTISVRDEAPREQRLQFSHQGPILARRGDRAYAARIPYDAETDRGAAWEALNFARDYRDVIAATETLAMFPQNIMAADTEGNIYYQRTGRVPRRAEGFDWSKPVDGSTSATEWQGVHPAGDHLQVLNPPQGYMQNCNIPPDAMMVGSPFKLSDQPSYLFSSAAYGSELDGWTNQRGARALELLHNDASVTIEEALAWAVDIEPYGTRRWQSALATALPDDVQAKEVAGWDGRLAARSQPALKYAYWRMELDKLPEAQDLRDVLDRHYDIVAGQTGAASQPALSNTQLAVIRSSFAQAMQLMREQLGRSDAAYGDVFRVGRDEVSWPVEGGGGDQFGLTTLRAMGYSAPNERFERWGNRGQTSTQLVHLSQPIESWAYLPVGQSDRPDSPHYTDQAENVFSKRQLKPSWWRPEQLTGNIVSRTVLDPR